MKKIIILSFFVFLVFCVKGFAADKVVKESVEREDADCECLSGHPLKTGTKIHQLIQQL